MAVLVYVNVILNGAPYPMKLIIPPIFGIGLSVAMLYWISKNHLHFGKK